MPAEKICVVAVEETAEETFRSTDRGEEFSACCEGGVQRPARRKPRRRHLAGVFADLTSTGEHHEAVLIDDNIGCAVEPQGAEIDLRFAVGAELVIRGARGR